MIYVVGFDNMILCVSTDKFQKWNFCVKGNVLF